MDVIVMGCGRVGLQVSQMLSNQGHEVTVIDHDANAIARLDPNFKGKVVRGIGFDRAVLIEAGVETAEAFVAASSSDNANIVAARIARNMFHVPRVVARLYDPLRAEIYQRLGLVTISTTTWGAERICEVVTHTDLDVVYTFGRGEASLVVIEAPLHLAGRTVQHLSAPGEIVVVSITRDGQALIPLLGSEFKEGDRIYLAVLPSAMERLERMLGLEGEDVAMYVIVVGGGNTGSYLTRLLLDGGQQVTVVEERPSVLEKLRLELPSESIIEGDGSSPTVLENAQISRAHVLAAVTGSDETNLVITSLARFEFSVPRVIARVNNPKNTWLFNSEMGVDVLLNQAEILAQLIAEEMSLGDMMTLLKLRRGDYSVVEEKVPPGAKGIGMELRAIDFKEQCVIAAIIRNGKMTLPRGDSVFQEGDEVVAIASPEGARNLAELLAFKVYPTREPKQKTAD